MLMPFSSTNTRNFDGIKKSNETKSINKAYKIDEKKNRRKYLDNTNYTLFGIRMNFVL